jgi:hypothetical protein
VRLFQLLTEEPPDEAGLWNAVDEKPPEKGGPVHIFGYENWHTDKRPRVLYLGKWRHPNTKNILIGGINLNKLNKKELATIQSLLPQIYDGGGSLKDHYDRLERVAPWVVASRRYQTWDKKYINSITVDTLHFVSPTKVDKTADDADKKHPAYRDPDDAKADLKSKAGGSAAKAATTARAKNAPEMPREPEPKIKKKADKPLMPPTKPVPPPERPEEPPEDFPPPPSDDTGLGMPPPPGGAPAAAPPKPAAKGTPKGPPPLPTTQSKAEVPPVPSSPPFKVSSAQKDIANLKDRKLTTTAGGTTVKKKASPGDARRGAITRPSPAAPKAGKKADSSSASKFKNKKKIR